MAERALTPCGSLLKQWRTLRKMSQLELATEAGVSARHVSFLETGRAQPSREMLLLLCGVLDVPLRERNQLLRAAGFADLYRHSDLDAPELASARRALEFVLARLEPYGAFVVDRAWNVLLANGAALRLTAALAPSPPPHNLMRLLFTTARPLVENWDELAPAMIDRMHREAAASGDNDSPERRLLDEILALPDVPRGWRLPDLTRAPSPIVPVVLRRDELRLSLFSMITTFGTPVDVALQELRIETFFPADEATEQLLRSFAG